MKTFLFTISALSAIIIFSCSKKNESNSTNPTPTGTQVTISGQTYTAQSQIKIPNAEYFYDSGSNPQIPSGGGYLSFTDTITDGVKLYEYTFFQADIPATGDTVALAFILYSTSPITTGTYPIYSDSKTVTSYPAAVFDYYDTRNTYSDSIGTGTLTITKIDMTNKVVNGTYSYAGTGFKGSSPSTIAVTNGQLNNIGLQEF
jgi:hypothetical protein